MPAQSDRAVRFGEQLTGRQERWRAIATAGPGIVWVTLFLFIPLMSVVVIGFMTRGDLGEITTPFTLDNYKRFFGFGLLGFDAAYPFIILRSLSLALSTTVLCITLGLPLAFFIAKLPDRYKNLALTLVMIPFWTNLLIRTYAWQILLAPDGAITRLAVFFQLLNEGESLYPSFGAVMVGTVCDYLPYLVLPLYASVEKLDWSVAEAAADLGAHKLRVFWHAILPQVVPGLVAGIIFVFIPATGQYVVPDLLGGAKTAMLGNAIAQQFGPSRDWPFGSAIAFFGMCTLLIALFIYAKIAGKQGRESLL